MKKKYYLMFEMHHCVCYSSSYFDTMNDAKKCLQSFVSRNDSLVDRYAIGYWQEIPCEDGNLKMFYICSESYRISS